MMKRRVQRMSWIQKHKKYLFLSGGALALCILSFVITISVAGFRTKKEKISKVPITINEYAYKKDESSIRINPESLKRAGVEVLKDKEKMIETKKENEIINDEPQEIKNVNTNENEKSVEVVASPVKKELSFIMPIDGEIILEYANDKLVYSNTLEEWITHNGIDIKGEEAMPVKASADGIIKDKKVDPRYGNTIIIEHDEGYKSVYSNLSSLDLVKVGDVVKQGDIISGVGEGYGFEVEEGPHIHWEIWKSGININPVF